MCDFNKKYQFEYAAAADDDDDNDVCVYSINVSEELGRATGSCSGDTRQGDDNSNWCEGEMCTTVDWFRLTNTLYVYHTV